MKSLIRYYLVGLCASLLLAVVGVALVQAATFAGVVVRLSSLQGGSSPVPLYIQVTIPSDSIVVEDEVRITVPSQWTVSSGSVSVATSDVPQNVVAWPGIAVNSVVGQTISLQSGNLAAGETYGFFITSGIGANPAAVEESQWVVTTFESGNEVYSQSVAITVTPGSNAIAVVGTVEAPASLLFVNLERVSPVNNTISQGDQVVYRLTYAHDLQYATSMTIKANWTAAVPVVSYVVGSATEGYGGTSPIVDTSAGTITWVTDLIPVGAGEQVVEFRLQGNTVVTSNPVTITVQGQIVSPSTTDVVSDQISYSYQPGPPVSPSPSPLPTVVATPMPSSSILPTASPAVRVPPAVPYPIPSGAFGSLVAKVDVIALTAHEATVRAWVPSGRAVQLVYKSEYSSTLQTVEGRNQEVQDFHLTYLLANTRYLFWFIDSSTGQRLHAEDFSLVTPGFSQRIPLSGFSMFVLYKDQFVSHWQVEENMKTQLLVAQLPYAVVTRLENVGVSIQTAWLEILYQGTSDPMIFSLQQERLHQLQTTIQLLPEIQNAQLFFRYRLPSGVQETVLVGDIRVVRPLFIINSQTNRPLEHVQVEVHAFQEETQTYTQLDLAPVFTKSQWNGVVPLTLQEGVYRFTFNLQGYHPQSIELSWPLKDSDVPIVLQPTGNIIQEIWGQLDGFLQGMHSGLLENVVPLFKNETLFTMALYSTSTLLAIAVLIVVSLKTHIPLHMLPTFIWRHIVSGSTTDNVLQLQILDKKTGRALSRARVTLINPENQSIEIQNVSNQYGRMTIQSHHPTVEAVVSKEGYESEKAVIVVGEPTQVISLAPSDDLVSKGKDVLKATAKIILSFGVELFLIIVLLLQLGLLFNFGWTVVPMLLVSVFSNIVWWLYHMSGYPYLHV